MNPHNKLPYPNDSRLHGFDHFFKKLASKISSLFKPEEVEVTFKKEGKKVSYTYKVTHK
jgi:hypothetical protein